MPVRKFKSQYYYADYYDVAGVRRRVSLQTKNMLVARMKYDEIIRRRDAVKENTIQSIDLNLPKRGSRERELSFA